MIAPLLVALHVASTINAVAAPDIETLGNPPHNWSVEHSLSTAQENNNGGGTGGSGGSGSGGGGGTQSGGHKSDPS